MDSADPARWRRIDVLLAEALELPAAERPHFLAEASDDPEGAGRVSRP